jgi:DMSO/TMAO reductase YedYZ molybdopterin-dependent catalytic subunit/rhodanese-related sulfurtransferase/glyoxylase-like metal-dependent hydrolase (beta-lactamase superfamily II)
MIFTQHYLACLSQASYLVGDETTGRAVVIDPRRDVGVYLEEAASRGLAIERVIETHVHADYLAGHLELAARTGAVVSFGEGADVSFKAETLRDGQRLSFGEVTLEILATPGHTPESISVVVYEHPQDEVPYGVLTGDTLFLGDVGRPDLQASSETGLSADLLAHRLYHSLHDKLLRLPDATRVFPAHGAGSACGKQISAETSSTLGEQRRSNYALAPIGEDEFVAAVTEGQPERPRNFEFDARRNREFRPLLDETMPASLPIADVLSHQAAGALLLDAREPADFAAGHIRGAINIGLQGRFAELAGAVISSDRPIVLAGDPDLAVEAKVRLGRAGFDTVIGQLDDLASVFTRRPDLIEASSRLSIEQLAEFRGLEPALQLVDVRGQAETALGTLPGAREIPLTSLTNMLEGLDRSAPVVVYCASGFCSQLAASLLRAAGFADVSDLLGGYPAWEAAGLPVDTDGKSAVAAVPEVSARTAAALVDTGALLLDVREPEEWQAGHAARATLLPMGQVLGRRDQLPQDRPIVVVCRSGGRSAVVAQALRARGLNAVNLVGGMCAWNLTRLPVETPGPDTAGLVVHTTHPLNCETRIPALIGGVVMPNARFYVRNHFETPRLDERTWRLQVSGLVERPLQLSIRDLRNMPSQALVVTLECAGNGRYAFDPPAEGEQWQLGAVSTAEWTGVPLAEILDRARITSDECEIVFRGADEGTAEDGAAPIRFERGLTVADAGQSGALLAYAMNGEPLPLQHGYPVRLIVPEWYAVASVKWLTEIEVTDSPFDGFFQTNQYVYEWPQAGQTIREPVRLMRVRSVITEPAGDQPLTRGDLVIRGVAWSGAAPIERVEVSVGDGPWQNATMTGAPARHSWQWWEVLTRLDQAGETTFRARATDLTGQTQPERPEWNRLGYGGNSVQTVTVQVE